VNSSLGSHVAVLAKRSVLRTLRQPVLVVPNLVFPLFLLAVMSGAGGQITKIAGFPHTNYITFILGATMVQCGIGAMTVGGNNLGSDMETGFMNRLALTPTQGWVLVVAQLAGVVVTGVLQAALVLAVGLAFGAHITAGAAGFAVILAIVAVTILAFGSIGQYIALRTGSSEAVQGVFPIALAAMFLSSMILPRNLITADWFKAIATYNPISYVVEGARSLLITGWDRQALELCFGITAGIAIIGTTVTVSRIRRALIRT